MSFYTNVTRIGNSICLREITPTGQSKRKISYEPTLYVKNDTEGSFKSLYGANVKAVKSESMSAAREFVKRYEGVQGVELFGQTNYVLAYINEMYPDGMEYDSSLVSVYGIDIETFVPEDENGRPTGFPNIAEADCEVNLITMQHFNDGTLTTFGCREYGGRDTNFILCLNEREMLMKFVNFWQDARIDVITGWNIFYFDLPYLMNRIKRVLGDEWAKKLSPWGSIKVEQTKFRGKEETTVSIEGIAILDYIDLYKKFTYTRQESYSLAHITQEELGHTKLDHSEFSNFNDFARNGWNKFVSYNVIDVKLIHDLDKKLKLIDLAMTLAYAFKMNYDDVFGPVKMWDTIIHNTLLAENTVIPLRDTTYSSDEGIEGAYVKSPIPGMYKWVVSLDATSLYPSNDMTLNMSPETYLGQMDCTMEELLAGKKFTLPDHICMSPIGAMFDKRKRGVIPRLFEKFMAERKKAKNEMLKLKSEYEKTQDKSLLGKISALDNKQMAFKIGLNSAYGALGNKGFRFYNSYIAESITMLGQFALKTIEANIDETLSRIFKLDKVHKFLIYVDTDSVYLNMEPVVDKFLSDKPTAEIVKSLEKVAVDIVQREINKLMDGICTTLNAYENRLYFKLEAVGDKSIFVSKKRYIVRVHSSEGVTYAKPKFKVMGLDMVRSSTPAFIREKLKGSLELIFDNDETHVQQYIASCKADFDNLHVNQIAFPRSANNLDLYSDPATIFKKGCPIHVRGALLYNHKLKEMGLDGQYPLISEGSKLKFVYLRVPNTLKSNIFAIPGDIDLPPEFNVHRYVDYDAQFDKTLVSAMQVILTAVGWSAVEQSSLESFFG